jgi:nucleotide-binding universal stress UspA family protein
VATVVVGVDSSEGGKDALRFALEEARLRKATLRAVFAWSFRAIATSAGMFEPPVEFDFSQLQKDNEAVLSDVIKEVAGDTPDVEIVEEVVEGPAAQVLVEESKGADLIVVGSRGHGGFTGLLLGSVSQQVAHHATCPVVIVPRSAES